MDRNERSVLQRYTTPTTKLLNPMQNDWGYHSQLQFKFTEQKLRVISSKILSENRILEPQPSPLVSAYRCHVKYAVRNDIHGQIVMGLFAPGTHDVMDGADSEHHHPAINLFLSAIKDELTKFQIPAYDEASHSGDLRYICIRASHITQDLLVTFVTRTLDFKQQYRSILHSLKNIGIRICGGYLDHNPNQGNSIFAYDTHHLIGKKYLRESLDGLQFDISPTSFFQINPWQAQNIYLRICDLLGSPSDSDAVAWDLYAGTGQIGIFMARQGYRVLSVEEVKSASKDAVRNAHLNQVQDRFTGVCSKTEEMLGCLTNVSLYNPAVVIANPSRRGIAPQAIEFIANAVDHGALFIYLSCEVDTFIRDAKLLAERSIRLLQLEAFDMMPGTEHLEWLGVFKK